MLPEPMRPLIVLLTLLGWIAFPATASDPPDLRGQILPTFTQKWVFETGG